MSVVTISNIPWSPSAWFRMWQWYAHAPFWSSVGCTSTVQRSPGATAPTSSGHCAWGEPCDAHNPIRERVGRVLTTLQFGTFDPADVAVGRRRSQERHASVRALQLALHIENKTTLEVKR
jgi:hypothetical protein